MKMLFMSIGSDGYLNGAVVLVLRYFLMRYSSYRQEATPIKRMSDASMVPINTNAIEAT